MPRYTLERDPTKTENAFYILDQVKTAELGQPVVMSWHATPGEATERMAYLERKEAAIAMSMGEQVAANENDPHAKVRESIRLLRAAIVESAAATGEEELGGAIADVVAMFVLSQNQVAVQLERVANAVVAQTKLLCHVYSGTVSEAVIKDAASMLKE